MGTFNGEGFIREQLDSIAAQTHQNWKLVISDDGSTDQTLEIARRWAREVGEERVDFRRGPGQGFAQNFLSMACDPNLRANFYAFADQDDIWLDDKLLVAVNRLMDRQMEIDSPRLYCGRTIYVNRDLKPVGLSPIKRKKPSFQNALVECIAGGNTMMFNHKSKQLIENLGVLPVVSHDWWVYKVISGADGLIFYDPEPEILYRQHENSLRGEKISISSRLSRLSRALRGQIAQDNSANLYCLQQIYQHLSTSSQTLFTEFRDIRNGSRYKRIFKLMKSTIRRENPFENLIFFLLSVMGRI